MRRWGIDPASDRPGEVTVAARATAQATWVDLEVTGESRQCEKRQDLALAEMDLRKFFLKFYILNEFSRTYADYATYF